MSQFDLWGKKDPTPPAPKIFTPRSATPLVQTAQEALKQNPDLTIDQLIEHLRGQKMVVEKGRGWSEQGARDILTMLKKGGWL